MDPQYLLLVVAALACPLAMGGLMWMMMRQQNSQQMPMNPPQTRSNAQRFAALLADREALDKEIRELEQVQAVEERRRDLVAQSAAQPEEVRT